MNRARRGSIVVAVLLLLAIGVVIAATALVSADSAAAASRAETARTQVRALAWSGVQAVMSELAERRIEILSGEEPEVTAEWSLFSLDDGSRGVVRLIDLDPEAPGLLAPENAKLDINSATVEALATIPGLSATLAERIVAARDEGPFSSVEQLLGVGGIGAELLYGAFQGEPHALTPDADTGAGASSLQRLLTVFSFDPNVQLGLDGDSDARGKLRVNIAQPWSEELRRAVADRLGDEVALALGAMMESGRVFENSAALVQAMIEAGISPDDWGLVLDVFTTDAAMFLSGCIDINRAPAEVLATLPGMTPELGGRIVEARGSLDADARRSLAWPVAENVLSPEQFAAIAGRITTRSAQWRVRLEVGVEGWRHGEFGSFLEESSTQPGNSPVQADATEAEPSLEHRMLVEAVIDIGSSRPRVAYLRDVTLLEPVLATLRPADEPPNEFAQDLAPEGDIPSASESEIGSSLDGESDLEPGTEDEHADTDAAQAPKKMSPATSPAPENGEQGGTTDSRIGRWSTRRAGKR